MAVVRPPGMRVFSLVLALLVATGCGFGQPPDPPPPPIPATTPIGSGPDHRPPALTRRTQRAAPVGRLRCLGREGRRFGVHVEVFGRRRTVIVPAGIGVAPPWRGRPPYVRAGSCSYALRTREPTGVIEVASGERLELGDLFDLWGQPLGARRVAGFRGRVHVWVGGRRWTGNPRKVPLTRHAQIVVSEDSRVPVHARYVFPPGL